MGSVWIDQRRGRCEVVSWSGHRGWVVGLPMPSGNTNSSGLHRLYANEYMHRPHFRHLAWQSATPTTPVSLRVIVRREVLLQRVVTHNGKRISIAEADYFLIQPSGQGLPEQADKASVISQRCRSGRVGKEGCAVAMYARSDKTR